MKKLSLIILITTIIFVAGCKKEEMPIQQTNTITKSGNWVLVKKGVLLQGTTCDLYKNINTGQEVYEAQNQTKTFRYDHKYWVDDFGVYHCSGSDDDCWTGTIGGETVIVLPKR